MITLTIEQAKEFNSLYKTAMIDCFPNVKWFQDELTEAVDCLSKSISYSPCNTKVELYNEALVKLTKVTRTSKEELISFISVVNGFIN